MAQVSLPPVGTSSVIVYYAMDLTRECPKKKALNSLTAKLSEEESHVGSLQLLNAMAKEKEEPKSAHLR